jgi:circadian clock protein KaiC
MHDIVRKFCPNVVVVDPISDLTVARNEAEVKPTLMRLIDFLKQEQITAIFTCLTSGGDATSSPEDSQISVSSLMDTWLMLRNVEFTGERNRTIFVRKSRGMAHSNQVREFVLSDKGMDLVDVYLGGDRVLTGSARLTQEALGRSAAALRGQDHERKLRQLAAKQKAIEAQIAALQAQAEAETEEVHFAITQETLLEKATQRNTDAMAQWRGGAHLANGQAKDAQ